MGDPRILRAGGLRRGSRGLAGGGAALRAQSEEMERRDLWPRTRWVREAIEARPRHAFAPSRLWQWDGHAYRPVDCDRDPGAWARLVYGDPHAAAITRLHGGVPVSSLSCTAVVADMLAALRVRPGQRVLELGTGTGWNTALLVYRAGPGGVVSVELDDELSADAEQSLARAGAQVRVCRGDGAAGCPDSGPYDRVLCTYAVETIPFAWVAQTRPGGRIVTPWGRLGHVALTVSDDGRSASGHVRGLAQFMPARAHAARRPDFRQLRERHELAHEYPLARDLLPLHQDWHLKFALRVAVPELRVHTAVDADGCNAWLHDEAGRAWASRTATGTGTLLVREGGSRRLAGELLAVWDAWLADGSPELYEYGVTVTERDQYAWARNPDTGPRWTLKEAAPTTPATV